MGGSGKAVPVWFLATSLAGIPGSVGQITCPLLLGGEGRGGTGAALPLYTRCVDNSSMAGPVSGTMKDEVALLATVTLLGVLLQGGHSPVWGGGGSDTWPECQLEVGCLSPQAAEGWEVS